MATDGTGAKASKELGQGWKVSPSVIIKSQTTFTIAEDLEWRRLNSAYMDDANRQLEVFDLEDFLG